MSLDYKTIPQWVNAVDDRTLTGIFAVHGNVDDGMDRSHPGSFAEATAGRDRTKHLWNHGGGMFDRGQTPPIAVIKSIREVGRLDLPPAVLGYAPDATGGAEVTREYLNTPMGNEVLAGVLAGAINEMSYAYDVTNASYTEEEERFIREIHGMKLFDTSDVNWGMNPATVGKKSALAAASFADHFSSVLASIEEFTERITDLKRLRETDGRTLSGVNIERITTLHAALTPMIADVTALIARTDQPKAVHPDVQRVYLDMQRLLAQANGVRL